MVQPLNALTRLACATLFFAGSIASSALCRACDTVCHVAEASPACCAAAHHEACTAASDCQGECHCMLSARDVVPGSPAPQRVTLDGPDTDGIAADWMSLSPVADRAALLLAAGPWQHRSPDRPVRVLYGVWRN